MKIDPTIGTSPFKSGQNNMFKSLKLKDITLAIFLTALGGCSATNGVDNKSASAEASIQEKSQPYWDMFYLEHDFINPNPANRKDALKVGELGVDGGDKALIMQLANNISADNKGNFDSVLISYKDKLVFESYFRRGRIDLPHDQASVSKAHVSLAVGRAIQMGYLSMDDLQKPIVSFFNDLTPSKLVTGADTITLQDALSMRSGIRINADKFRSLIERSRKKRGFNFVQEFLQHSDVITPESKSFKYQGSDPLMVIHVLERVVPVSAKHFIKNEVFGKLGITQYHWKDDINGTLASNTNLMSRDMIKVGQLFVNNGKWQGEQLISKAYLNNIDNGKNKPAEDWIPEKYFYNNFWYQTDMTVGGKTYKAKFAWGGGEQYILTFDELNLVAVFTASSRENETMQLTEEVILPAFVKEDYTAKSH